MKTILIILLISYLLQVLINIVIAVYNQWYKGATIGDVINELSLFHWATWIPVFGFVVQIVCLTYLLISELWRRFKRLKIR